MAVVTAPGRALALCSGSINFTGLKVRLKMCAIGKLISIAIVFRSFIDSTNFLFGLLYYVCNFTTNCSKFEIMCIFRDEITFMRDALFEK